MFRVQSLSLQQSEFARAVGAFPRLEGLVQEIHVGISPGHDVQTTFFELDSC